MGDDRSEHIKKITLINIFSINLPVTIVFHYFNQHIAYQLIVLTLFSLQFLRINLPKLYMRLQTQRSSLIQLYFVVDELLLLPSLMQKTKVLQLKAPQL